MAKAAHAVPQGFHAITPQLTLDNAAQALDWYKNAFGAEEINRSAGPDGKIMHAELRIGDSRFFERFLILSTFVAASAGVYLSGRVGLVCEPILSTGGCRVMYGDPFGAGIYK
jgi:hypothetical protein